MNNAVVLYCRVLFRAARTQDILDYPADRFVFKPESLAFSRAQATAVLLASTCVTSAPAFAAASVAPPVYPKRFKILYCGRTF
jgi:hypothetical protein